MANVGRAGGSMAVAPRVSLGGPKSGGFGGSERGGVQATFSSRFLAEGIKPAGNKMRIDGSGRVISSSLSKPEFSRPVRHSPASFRRPTGDSERTPNPQVSNAKIERSRFEGIRVIPPSQRPASEGNINNTRFGSEKSGTTKNSFETQTINSLAVKAREDSEIRLRDALPHNGESVRRSPDTKFVPQIIWAYSP